MDYDESVYRVLMQVPKGKVTTYKLIACALGNPRSSRAVGNALGRNPDPDGPPCYRVIKSDGSLGGYAGGLQEKIRRLRADGITVKDGRVLDLENVLFIPKPIRLL
jgi:methylated-DNA-[protein]-cysteine S-methyltransferase